ncbi:MAG: fibronectin type III domain-containing protein [Candidatus Thiodiazotropha sp. (ex Epidulcina cf. delphinae)]|nr:fibronectin type III domain-containing protein [Candidatus Thiodiazotropha sp. (ex Epidulcina cf. delphinae)]
MKTPPLLLNVLLTFILQACGGGGGGGGDNETGASKFVRWIPPSTRSDGSFLPLSSLAGYRIYYGKVETDLQRVADIEDNSINEYTLTLANSGDYYIGVTAYDTSGLESEISNLVLK